jgi:hemin uptake protein HemP
MDRESASLHLPPLSAEVRSPATQPVGASAIPCFRSEELFGKVREILIQHGGAQYRLRITHSNKLILTK